MTDFRDLSPLPEDEAYWEQLQSKITAGLAPLVRTGVEARQPWWSPLASRAWALGGLGLAAGLAALLLAPRREVEPRPQTGWLLPLERDPAVAAFLASDRPPPVATLISLTGGGR